MKRILALLAAFMFLLCSCDGDVKKPNDVQNDNVDNTDEIILAGEPAAIDKALIGKWIDVETEQMFEFTNDGYYYEWINESFTSEKTRYIAKDGNLTRYLDSDRAGTEFTVPYEIKDGNLIVAGELVYKPIDIKTSAEEME